MDLLEMFGCEIYVEQTFVTMDVLTITWITSMLNIEIQLNLYVHTYINCVVLKKISLRFN